MKNISLKHFIPLAIFAALFFSLGCSKKKSVFEHNKATEKTIEEISKLDSEIKEVEEQQKFSESQNVDLPNNPIEENPQNTDEE